MREYRVLIKGKTSYVHANANYKAKLDGVKIYMSEHPGRYTFSHLMSDARARLTHPEVSGRKPMMGFRDDLDFGAFKD